MSAFSRVMSAVKDFTYGNGNSGMPLPNNERQGGHAILGHPNQIKNVVIQNTAPGYIPAEYNWLDLTSYVQEHLQEEMDINKVRIISAGTYGGEQFFIFAIVHGKPIVLEDEWPNNLGNMLIKLRMLEQS